MNKYNVQNILTLFDPVLLEKAMCNLRLALCRSVEASTVAFLLERDSQISKFPPWIHGNYRKTLCKKGHMKMNSSNSRMIEKHCQVVTISYLVHNLHLQHRY